MKSIVISARVTPETADLLLEVQSQYAKKNEGIETARSVLAAEAMKIGLQIMQGKS